ncbi:MAG: Uma2 family endonuclease [Myxococcota bacterium]
MELGGTTVSIQAPAEHLPLRIRPAVPLSDDELFELCRMNRELRIERTREGEIIVMSPTGGETGRRNFTLIGLFFAWVAKNQTGVGFDSSTGFILPNGAERSPDLAWVGKRRWEALTPEQRRRFVPLCPDFVIELRSPSEDLGELQAKMAEYRDNGAALGILIDPEDRLVFVYRTGRAPERLDAPSVLSGEPEMQGLELDMTSIW